MRKLFLLCLLFPFVMSAQQRLHVTLFGGFSNYQGDLQDKTFTLDQSNGAFGAGVKYDLTSHISIRSGFNYGRVKGDDKLNKPILQARNLSFQSKILEGHLLGEYTFLDLDQNRFSPYVFGGIAVFHFNPYTRDTLGNKIFLHPLSTEGQGLAAYPDRKPYKLTQFAIPFGGGIKLRINENAVLGYEFGFRKTFFDYLDDLSTTYVDAAILVLEKGPKAVEMSYRGGELKTGNTAYPADGTIRGGSKFKDWYYFTGITLAVSINTGNRSFFGNGNRKGRTDCPKVL
ncbi:MAG: outer membrane beta-barrel protein [Chitinophagaceae bacterium]|nr:outer membrane beta-barrel protein [Chitinophagaceae bacterium]